MKLITTPLRVSTHVMHAWLSCALCHCSNERVIRLEFRQSIQRLVYHHSFVRRTSSATPNTEWAPISEWNVCRVVCHPRSVCGWFRKCVVFLQFSLHQKCQAVPLDPHRRLLVDHQLELLEPHVSRLHRCRRLPRPRHFPQSLPAITIA